MNYFALLSKPQACSMGQYGVSVRHLYKKQVKILNWTFSPLYPPYFVIHSVSVGWIDTDFSPQTEDFYQNKNLSNRNGCKCWVSRASGKIRIIAVVK